MPKAAIRRFAQQIAEQFHPNRIILFGSHAYGNPDADSDVDILVIMPTRNQLDQAFKIRLAVPASFPLDLIVRTPKNMRSRLKDGDLFHTEVMKKGKVLYEKGDSGVGVQSRGRLPGRKTPRTRQRVVA